MSRCRTLAAAVVAVACAAVPIATADAAPRSYGSRALAKPMKGSDVRELQRLLTAWGLPTEIDGQFGLHTKLRVRVDTWPDVWFNGRIATVASQGEYTPRNVQTRAQRAEQVFGVKVLVDPDARLKPGMAAEVDLGVEGRAK